VLSIICFKDYVYLNVQKEVIIIDIKESVFQLHSIIAFLNEPKINIGFLIKIPPINTQMPSISC